jgi:small-conductance mechanosensitive channel
MAAHVRRVTVLAGLVAAAWFFVAAACGVEAAPATTTTAPAIAQPAPVAAEPAAKPPSDSLAALQQDMRLLKERLAELISAVPDMPTVGPIVVSRVTKGYGDNHVWSILAYLVVMFAAASFGEAVVRRLFRPLYERLPTLDAQSDLGKLGVLLVRALTQLVEIAAFSLIAIIMFFVVFVGHEAARLVFWTIFSFVALLRVLSVGLRLLLVPRLPALRLPAIDDGSARHLYRGFILIGGMVIGAGLLNSFLFSIGLPPGLQMACSELLLIVGLSVIALVICRQRRMIATLVGIAPADGGRRGALGDLLVANWHVFAVSVLVGIGVMATVERLLTGQKQTARIIGTLGVFVCYPILYGLIRIIVRQFFEPGDAGERPQHLANADAANEGAGGDPADNTYGPVILRNSRIALAVIGVVAVIRIWDVNLSAMTSEGIGTHIAQSAFEIIVTLLLASSAWGIIKVAINRHLPHEKLGALDLVGEDHEAGVGLSRLETLLPLLRKFLFVTILVMVAMIVVSSMGVNIGPLLAGAGVVGIAVGFGAQTLVRDILSGVFFLFDDAFRIGEYIDVGEGKGTVERMSIRSLVLRHHLGPVNTIPFGVIRRVTNYARDWTIMKLEIRVPYETDLERLRKLIKNVGQDLAADPVHGPHFIQPLKSQGAYRMDDSAFVVRVKFMAKPGDEFVLRREVFRHLQAAFKNNGIEFASRRVTVDDRSDGDAPGDREAAAANIALLPSGEAARSRG